MPQMLYRFGSFGLDPGAHVLLRDGARISIQEQPFQVLLALLENPGQVVTREALRFRLWGTSTFVDFDQSLNSAVRRLRMALDDNSREPSFVETIPRVGFRLLTAVTVERHVRMDVTVPPAREALTRAARVVVPEQTETPAVYGATLR